MARLASGKASRTARITAAMRHRHLLGGARPLVFEDRFAYLFLDLPSAMAAMPTPSSIARSAGCSGRCAAWKARCWRARATSRRRSHRGCRRGSTR